MVPDRFSNGDENQVILSVYSSYSQIVSITILDELPAQFQIRKLRMQVLLRPGETTKKVYSLKPKERGAYEFGRTNTLCETRLGLLQRRDRHGAPEIVKVYPSFLHLEKYELSAISQSLKLSGQKRMRRLGQSTEFDHIKEYVFGDDPRHINWTATARKGEIMINHFVDEKSQSIYTLIDKGRPMRMPFEGMTLLDYSINAALVLSNVALKKGDRAGLVTFQHRAEDYLAARKRSLQLNLLLELLYRQQTEFNESDFSSLYWFITQKVRQRSLLMLFTNFESTYTLERQLPYLKLINKQHLLLLIFFRNTELDTVLSEEARSTSDIYNKTIAQQIAAEKDNISSILSKNGILSLYTQPQNLSVDVINKYIEIKAKRLL
ncbi:MAG: DUF58 domain-containing protein [Bacteroidota bacterium]